jgi:Na+/H+ antiporter NhaD/arsenite permease-like protein
MARIPAIQNAFEYLMKKNALLVSTMSCQVISNVPSAILLSQFTGDYHALLLGVNIGGCGTLISSLASLITFREFTKHEPQGTKKYLLLFSAFNFAFLLILLGACALLLL